MVCILKEKALPRKENEVARQLAYPQRMKATSSKVENAAFGVAGLVTCFFVFQLNCLSQYCYRFATQAIFFFNTIQ